MLLQKQVKQMEMLCLASLQEPGPSATNPVLSHCLMYKPCGDQCFKSVKSVNLQGWGFFLFTLFALRDEGQSYFGSVQWEINSSDLI